jgi:hypothetical protein
MITVTFQRNIFDVGSRESYVVAADEPKALRDVLPSGCEAGDGSIMVTVDGEERVDGEVAPGSLVAVWVKPGLAAVAALPWWGQLLFVIGTTAASNLIQKHLAPKAEQPVADDSTSESYRGFSNSYFPGGSIPLVFGLRRFAPPVVGQAIESSFGSWVLGGRETMKLLLCLGHGPIEGLGDLTGKVSKTEEMFALKSGNPINIDDRDAIGLKINGQPASNYSDVFVYWRTGEIEQDAITALGGFPDSSVDVTIEQDILEYSSSTDITEAGFPSGVYGSGSDIDAASGESLSHTMTDEADRMLLTISFPSGIYKDAGGGGTTTSSASFRLQYWPVDSGGTRTGDTVLLPEWTVTGDETSGQTIQFDAAFFSPNSYAGTSQFGYLACSGQSAHAKVTGPVDPDMLPANFQLSSALKFSAAAWLRPSTSGYPPTLKGQSYVVFSSRKGSMATSAGSLTTWPFWPRGASSSTSHAGVQLCIDRIVDLVGTNPDEHRVCLYVWEGATGRVWYSANIGASLTGWKHVGLSYSGATGVVTFYLDGTPLAASTQALGAGPTGVVLQEEGDFVLGHSGVPSGTMENFSGDLDLCEFILTERVEDDAWFQGLTTQFDYTGARTTTLASGMPGLAFGTYLSEEIASAKIESLAFPTSTTTGQVVDVVGSSLQAAPQTDAPLWTGDQGIPLRGRYHVELFRSDAVDDDPAVEMNKATWDQVTLITDEDFSHPGVAQLAVSIDADDQISNSRPDVSVLVRGVKVPRWDGASVQFPTFVTEWTRNPAWIALYLLTEEEVGLGAIWDRRTAINLTAWKAWADYCDEGVEDAAGTPAFFDGDPVSASADHPNGELHFKIGLLDASGVSTGEVVPSTWTIGHTLRIKTASDSSWEVASADDSVRLAITSMKWESDDTAANGYQHWVQIECDWTSSYSLPGVSNVTGTAVGFEARHECDLILDEKVADGWDTVLQVMRAARAAPIVLGDKLSVWVDRARPRDFLITQAQIVEGSYSKRWESNEERHNGLEYEFVDRNLDYEVQPWIEHHPSVSGEVDPREIRVAPPELLRGITRISEVRRHATFRLNQLHLLRVAHSFQLGPDGLGLAPGDRVGISHDVALSGESGRVFADVTTATEIELDRPVVVAFGSTYEIEVRSSGQVAVDGTELRQTVALDATMIPGSGTSTLAAGSTITLAGSGFTDFTPEQGDVYSFGETASSSEDAVVVRVTLDPASMLRTVEAVEYNASVYTDNEFGDLPADPGADLPSPPGNSGVGGGIKRPGSGSGSLGGALPTAKERTKSTVGGKPVSVVLVSWPIQEKATGGTNVYVGSLTNGARPTPRLVGRAAPGEASVEVSAKEFAQGERLRFFIQHISASGVGRSAHACPSVDMTFGGRMLTPAAPTITTPKSRNAQAAYSITFPPGRTPEGVEVRAGGWILGQKVAHALRDGDLVGEWVFGADNSVGAGAVTHYVRSLLPSGQVSSAATFENFDATPLGMAELDATAHEDAWASGVLDGLQIDSSTTPPHLKFTGSGLEGTFTTPEVDMTVAKRYFVEVSVEAEQVHPDTWADWTEPWDSRTMAGRLWEGPTGGSDALLSSLVIEWTPSETGTPATNFASVHPGVEHFRSAKFRVRVTRPTSAFDCRIRRFGVRVLSVADYEPGDIDGGSY